MEVVAQVTRVSAHSADPPDLEGSPGEERALGSAGQTRRSGPIERVMSIVIRKLAWSRLSDPKVAVTVSGLGLLLGMIVGATAPNVMTLPIRLPLSVLPSLASNNAVTMVLLYTGDVLACLGLAGMLWAHSQGWRPDPRQLLLASAGDRRGHGQPDARRLIGYRQLRGLRPDSRAGRQPVHHHPGQVPRRPLPVPADRRRRSGRSRRPSTAPSPRWSRHSRRRSAARTSPLTIWVLMILNGLVFIGVGWLLLKTSDDPVRATLFWTANPVLIQQLVSGGHLDTFVAAAAICAIQVARRVSGLRGDVLIGVLIGLACGIKINAVLVAVGLAWPLLRRREWLRLDPDRRRWRWSSLALEYSSYGLDALKPMFGGLEAGDHCPRPGASFQIIGEALGFAPATVMTVINCLWPIAMIVRRLADLPADLLGSATRGRGAVRADIRLDPRRPVGVPVVHRDRLGGADPGAAQPDDPVADHRHRPARLWHSSGGHQSVPDQ